MEEEKIGDKQTIDSYIFKKIIEVRTE